MAQWHLPKSPHQRLVDGQGTLFSRSGINGEDAKAFTFILDYMYVEACTCKKGVFTQDLPVNS